ncbi:hypothetical protein ACFV2X_43100 [Streptomyces sp. NPDC059679]|uniref:hypothetical protein n=1 Tax=Streptomyces sp. NPDC059679 TaxID=3346903 RepID=UPI0036947700
MKLPDIYETRQARALLVALQAGDTEQARKIEDHLLAEAADGPGDREALREELRAALLFRAHVDASAAGNEPTAQLFQSLLLATCSEQVIKATIAGAYLQVGLEHGSLPAQSHDFLAEHMAGANVGEEMRELAAGIKRVP